MSKPIMLKCNDDRKKTFKVNGNGFSVYLCEKHFDEWSVSDVDNE